IAHAQQVAVGQQDAVGVHAKTGELGQVDVYGPLVAGQHDGRAVGLFAEAARAVDGLGQGHGNVVQRLQARHAHFAVHIDAAVAVGLHAHGDLRILHILGQAPGQQFARFVLGQAGDLDRADEGKLYGAVGVDVVAVTHV